MHCRLLLLTANLADMPGFALMNGVAIGPDGAPDPLTQLFRSSAVGVEVGPFISQVGAEECGKSLYATFFFPTVPTGFHAKEESFSCWRRYLREPNSRCTSKATRPACLGTKQPGVGVG